MFFFENPPPQLPLVSCVGRYRSLLFLIGECDVSHVVAEVELCSVCGKRARTVVVQGRLPYVFQCFRLHKYIPLTY